MAILSTSVKKNNFNEDEHEAFELYRRIVGAIILVSSPVSMDTLSRLLRLSREDIIDIIGDRHSVLQ
ncbi:hypothetical protein EX30DRAFT_338129 [Ascodesmis nigricans]|uniref:Uncharacterized protein n=1 Tax=Ascodesmis nigricans TaxID=341454 RepID=A0A4V3SJC4_9PEZI|nr:hypothetical protein EX30DRAFT_338129 [Ascodesmis nigricans]